MLVTIKSFDVEMQIKNKGIELDVYDNDGVNHIGDLYVSKAGITWCKGKTTRAKGVTLTWAKFTKLMEEQ